MINPIPEETSIKYPLFVVLSYLHLSPSYQAYTYALSTQTKPTSFKEAIQQPKWKQAIDEERHALELNNSWTIVTLSLDRKPLGWKRDFKLKKKVDGSIEIHKDIMVAMGYSQ